MQTQLANFIYGHTKLTDLISWLVDAIFWILKEILQKVFEPVLVLIYDVLIWLPLQVINAMNTLFHFFASGFADQIFGGKVNPDGSISYSFSFSSQLGQIMTFTLILSVVLFFVYFIVAFATGSRGYGANRAKELKWPFMMFVVFIVTPPVLILADSLMGALMNGLGGAAPQLLSQADVNNLKNYAFADFQKLTNIQSTVTSLQGLSQINDNITKALQIIKDHADDDDVQFGQLKYYLQYTQTDIQYINNYLHGGGSATLSGDYSSFVSMVNSWNPGSGGMYISDDNANNLTNISTNLQHFQTSFIDLIADHNSLMSDDSQIGWNSLAKYDNTLKTAIMTPLSNITDSLGKSTGPSDLGYFFNNSDTSITNILCSTSKKYPALSALPWYRNITPPFSVVQLLYVTVTGDTDKNNWSVMPSIGWGNPVIENMNIFNFFLGGFACWSMILIMWSFVQSSIKRTYYIIGYWIVGFLYIANGAANPSGATNWYKMVFGKWIGVLVMFILYMMVGVILNMITPAIQDGLSQGGFAIDDIQLLSMMGVIFAIEAAYQTAYQLSQTYMGEWGAKDETFQSQNPVGFLTHGANLLKSAKDQTIHYATGGPIKNAYKSVASVPQYWRDRKSAKMGYQNTKKAYAETIAGKDATRDKAKKSGYDFSNRGEISAGNGLYDRPAAPNAGGGGAGGAGGPAAGGGAPAAAPVARHGTDGGADYAGRVRVGSGPGNFADADWRKEATAGARAKKLITSSASNAAAWAGEQAHNAAAWVLRRTPIAGMITGAAGLFGGEVARNKAKWLVGSSKRRMTRAEKNWATKNGMTVRKDTRTGDLLAFNTLYGAAADIGSSTARQDQDNPENQIFTGMTLPPPPPPVVGPALPNNALGLAPAQAAAGVARANFERNRNNLIRAMNHQPPIGPVDMPAPPPPPGP